MLSITEQLQREFAKMDEESVLAEDASHEVQEQEADVIEVPQRTPALPPQLLEHRERERERREARRKQEQMQAKAEFRANPVAYYLKVSGLPKATVAHRLGISPGAVKSWMEKPERTQWGVVRKIELRLLEMEKSGRSEAFGVTGV